MSLEKNLIEFCSPTLASLKTGSLFKMSIREEQEWERQIENWNIQLRDKGLFLIVLKRWNDNVLIYVCRKSHLQADLKKQEIRTFLQGYGYQEMQLETVLERLKFRLKAEEFPHEIGIFLGYPLGDVIGFIENAGKNSKCTGCWKVYCNECEAQKMFARFKKCRDVYERLWKQGRSIFQLTVAA